VEHPQVDLIFDELEDGRYRMRPHSMN
jgi:hypothetical protein